MPIQPLRDIPLAKLTTFKLGGRARYYFEATNDDEIVEAVEWANDARITLHVIGGGSNLVVADSGTSGLVLKVSTQGISAARHGTTTKVRANAGVTWDDLVTYAVDFELSGIECLSGIPGSVGATPIQNVGAYGQEVSQSITQVAVYDRVEHRRRTFQRDDCGFGYRDSRFKSGEPDRYVILNVEFELNPAATAPIFHGELARQLATCERLRPTVGDVRLAVMTLRQQKSMLAQDDADTLRSAGSFFVNPIVDPALARRLGQQAGASMPVYPQPSGQVKLSAGWLIEHAGWSRGQRIGNVGLSPHHCLVLVAYDHAEANDIVHLAHRIRDSVIERFGVELRPEPNFWGFEALDRGLPCLEEDAPPTLGSASWRTSDEPRG